MSALNITVTSGPAVDGMATRVFWDENLECIAIVPGHQAVTLHRHLRKPRIDGTYHIKPELAGTTCILRFTTFDDTVSLYVAAFFDVRHAEAVLELLQRAMPAAECALTENAALEHCRRVLKLRYDGNQAEFGRDHSMLPGLASQYFSGKRKISESFARACGLIPNPKKWILK